jgi:hypothetical protein
MPDQYDFFHHKPPSVSDTQKYDPFSLFLILALYHFIIKTVDEESCLTLEGKRHKAKNGKEWYSGD